mmetsp:Transcript_2204/g.7249  ORF Transcript_2204/g.7249 Transcript_2204/m.7249 type:complete len:265 (+) Transcript_2204:176-970(+)
MSPAPGPAVGPRRRVHCPHRVLMTAPGGKRGGRSAHPPSPGGVQAAAVLRGTAPSVGPPGLCESHPFQGAASGQPRARPGVPPGGRGCHRHAGSAAPGAGGAAPRSRATQSGCRAAEGTPAPAASCPPCSQPAWTAPPARRQTGAPASRAGHLLARGPAPAPKALGPGLHLCLHLLRELRGRFGLFFRLLGGLVALGEAGPLAALARGRGHLPEALLALGHLCRQLRVLRGRHLAGPLAGPGARRRAHLAEALFAPCHLGRVRG